MKKYSMHRLSLAIVSILMVMMTARFDTVSAQDIYLDHPATIQWNPDGTELMVLARNGIFIYGPDFQLLRYQEQDIANPFFFGGWNQEGTKFLFGKQLWSADPLEMIFEYPTAPRGWINGDTEVFAITGTAVLIYDAANGNLIRTILLEIQIEDAAASPDGTRIATRVGNLIAIIDPNQTEAINLYFQPVDNIASYIWSPDSQRIAYSALTLVSPETQGSVATADPKNSLVFNFDIMDANTGEVLQTSDPIPDHANLTWSRDSSRIAGLTSLGGSFGDIYVWDADTATLLTVFSTSDEVKVTGGIAYSTYGGTLAIGVTSDLHPNGQSITVPTPQTVPPRGIVSSFGNDGLQIIATEPTIEHLTAIRERCASVRQSEQSILPGIPQIKSSLPDFITQIKSLPSNAIPAGCTADLIAVAEAIIAQ